VPAPLGRHAYRIVQEALTNARKHADSAPVQLYVGGCAGDKLTIDVRNRIPSANGVGRIPGASAGLLGLKERAVLAGGELEHGVDNGVFHLRAWLPWPR
jgi:signal transduction histidine kinase